MYSVNFRSFPDVKSPNLKTDFKYLKMKVDMGAEFIVTQMFFDNQKYFDFVKKCRENDIHVPIIPGLKPISAIGQLVALPKIFHIDLPEDLSEAIQDCKNPKEVRQVGTEFMIQQCKELMDFGVPVLHFYTMGKPEQTYNIAKAIF